MSVSKLREARRGEGASVRWSRAGPRHTQGVRPLTRRLTCQARQELPSVSPRRPVCFAETAHRCFEVPCFRAPLGPRALKRGHQWDAFVLCAAEDRLGNGCSSEKSKGRLSASRGHFLLVSGAKCVPRAFSPGPARVRLESGRCWSVLPRGGHCSQRRWLAGPALPAARPCSCGVARPGCLLLLLQTAGWRPLTTWPQECLALTLALATGWSWPSALGGPFVPLSVSMRPVRAPAACAPRRRPAPGGSGQVSWSRRRSRSASPSRERLPRGYRACGVMAQLRTGPFVFSGQRFWDHRT